jgi:DNA repair protein RadC
MNSKTAPQLPQITRCRHSKDAANFWRAHVENLAGFKATAESFFALTLDADRGITGCNAVASKSFADAQRFADELFQSDFLREVAEFVLIHHRPGVALEASVTDIDRAREVILAGRAKKTELLDYLLIGKPDEAHPSGCISFYKIRGFSAAAPFAKTLKKPCQSSVKAEASR